MANICSVDFTMNFKDKESRDNFKADYASKMEEASKKNEGVKLSK